jgi:hypothetical protein
VIVREGWATKKKTKWPLRYTKWPRFIPNCHRIYQTFPFQGPTKFTRIGIFGLKIYHVAALLVYSLNEQSWYENDGFHPFVFPSRNSVASKK